MLEFLQGLVGLKLDIIGVLSLIVTGGVFKQVFDWWIGRRKNNTDFWQSQFTEVGKKYDELYIKFSDLQTIVLQQREDMNMLKQEIATHKQASDEKDKIIKRLLDFFFSEVRHYLTPQEQEEVRMKYREQFENVIE